VSTKNRVKINTKFSENRFIFFFDYVILNTRNILTVLVKFRFYYHLEQGFLEKGKKMTQAEAKGFETDVVVFPAKPEVEISVRETETEIIEIKKRTLKVDINKRFARLRKNIRKRSAGIL
jgi:hypothetical protein